MLTRTVSRSNVSNPRVKPFTLRETLTLHPLSAIDAPLQIPREIYRIVHVNTAVPKRCNPP